MRLKNIKTRSNKETPLMRRLSMKKEQRGCSLNRMLCCCFLSEEACYLTVKDKDHAKRSDDLVRIVYCLTLSGYDFR